MYSENVFDIYLMSKYLFFVAKGDTGQLFKDIIAYNHYSFH